MDINNFSKQVTLKEGLRKSISIAQVKEVLKVTNAMLGGALYKSIRNIK